MKSEITVSDIFHQKFTGQVDDTSASLSASGEDTGLMYYNARYYDPKIGRFISADTIIPDPSFSQSFNRYMYVAGNPVCFNDPSGHKWGKNTWNKVVNSVTGSVDLLKTVYNKIGGKDFFKIGSGIITRTWEDFKTGIKSTFNDWNWENALAGAAGGSFVGALAPFAYYFCTTGVNAGFPDYVIKGGKSLKILGSMEIPVIASAIAAGGYIGYEAYNF